MCKEYFVMESYVAAGAVSRSSAKQSRLALSASPGRRQCPVAMSRESQEDRCCKERDPGNDFEQHRKPDRRDTGRTVEPRAITRAGTSWLGDSSGRVPLSELFFLQRSARIRSPAKQ